MYQAAIFIIHNPQCRQIIGSNVSKMNASRIVGAIVTL